MTRRAQPEAALQRSVIQHLTWRARPGVFAFHVPNGGMAIEDRGRDPQGDRYSRRRSRLQLHLRGPGVICSNSKPRRGRLTDVQRVVHERLRAAGAEVAVAHGIDEALAWLDVWNLLRRRSGKSTRSLGVGEVAT